MVTVSSENAMIGAFVSFSAIMNAEPAMKKTARAASTMTVFAEEPLPRVFIFPVTARITAASTMPAAPPAMRLV